MISAVEITKNYLSYDFQIENTQKVKFKKLKITSEDDLISIVIYKCNVNTCLNVIMHYEHFKVIVVDL